jgi:hypothetical protein
MIHDLSGILAKTGTQLKLYSPFPFPNRKERRMDPFGGRTDAGPTRKSSEFSRIKSKRPRSKRPSFKRLAIVWPLSPPVICAPGCRSRFRSPTNNSMGTFQTSGRAQHLLE